MNRRTLLYLFIGSTALPALAAEPSPRDIVAEIYRISAGQDGKYQGPSAFDDEGVRTRYFSKPLLAAIVRMEKLSKEKDEPILDFDPVTNSQDPDVKDRQITVESESPSKTVVAGAVPVFRRQGAVDRSL
jgi:hypothetical protein